MVNNISDINNRIKDWEYYLNIIEDNAEKSEVKVEYEGFKQKEDLTKCIFKLKNISDNDKIKLKELNNEKVMMMSNEDLLYSSADFIGEYIGTIEDVNFKKNTIEILLEPEFQGYALEGNLYFESNGLLKISKRGDLSQVRALKRGLNNLKNGRGKNPNLSTFLFDAKKISKEYKDIVIKDNELLYKNLNENQISAVQGVLNANDIFLIQGPPGTGKTTVISEICYQNAIRGMKTLVASQTNLAVDNALSRLVNNPKIRALRKGNVLSVEEEGIKYTEENILDTWFENTSDICKDKLKKYKSDLGKIEFLENDLERIINLILNNLEIYKELESLEEKLIKLTEEKNELKYRNNEAINSLEALKRDSNNLDALNYRLNKINRVLEKLINKYSINDTYFEEKKNSLYVEENAIRELENKVNHLYGLREKIKISTKGFVNTWGTSILRNKKISDGYIAYINRLIKENYDKQHRLNEKFYNFNEDILNKKLVELDVNIKETSMKKKNIIEKKEKNNIEIKDFNIKLNSIISTNLSIETLKNHEDLKNIYLNLLNEKKDELVTYIKVSNEWMNSIKNRKYGDSLRLRDLYIDNANVIGITCVQSGNRRFSENYPDFDVVIIDEVSKATPPELILPMLKGKKIVLVGDHKQLPPMIGMKTFEELEAKLIEEEQEERDLGHIKKSLFEELFFDINSKNKVMLNVQYRMHKSIMDTINQFYITDGNIGLKCGLRDDYKGHEIETKYITSENRILWIDTPFNKMYFENKTKNNKGIYNKAEINIIDKILKDINEASKRINEKKEVAIITFYGEQSRRISKSFIETNKYTNLRLRVGTVDRFQGMESEIVIASFVRNNDNGEIGFTKDARRVNVALSRAKNLLILVGCSDFFCRLNRNSESRKFYKNVFKVIDSYGGIRDSSTIFN